MRSIHYAAIWVAGDTRFAADFRAAVNLYPGELRPMLNCCILLGAADSLYFNCSETVDSIELLPILNCYTKRLLTSGSRRKHFELLLKERL